MDTRSIIPGGVEKKKILSAGRSLRDLENPAHI